jgi:hypothetical protein
MVEMPGESRIREASKTPNKVAEQLSIICGTARLAGSNPAALTN